jgi:soluble lytic murein transglycosylase
MTPWQKWYRELALASILFAGAASNAFAQDEDLNSFFVDKTGVPTLTNQPERYRGDSDYLEITIDYQPIVIKNRYSFTSTGRIETNDDYVALIRHYSNQYSLNANLVQAVIKAESNFDPYAISKVGAQGLMQLMPGTAAELAIRDPFDPGQNIAGGTQYLFKLLKMFGNDLDLALAAYNAGPGTVKRYGGVPPYQETVNYIAKVKRFMVEFASGGERVLIDRSTRRHRRVFSPSSQAPYVIHFKTGASQPAQSVREEQGLYVLEYNLKTYTVRKSLVSRIEEHS